MFIEASLVYIGPSGLEYNILADYIIILLMMDIDYVCKVEKF